MKTIAWVKRSGRLSTTHVVVALQGDVPVIACGKPVPMDMEHREEGGKSCTRCRGNKTVTQRRHAGHVKLATPVLSESFNGWPQYQESKRKVDPKKLCEACEWAYHRQKQMWLCSKCRVKFKIHKIEFTEEGPRHLEEIV